MNKSIAVLFILLIGAGAILQEQWLPYPQIFPGVMNVLHFPAGIVFVWAVMRIFSVRLPPGFGLALAMLIGAAFFSGVELIQPYFHRSRSLEDFFNSMAGCLAGGLLVISYRQRGIWLLVATVTLVLLLLQAWPLLGDVRNLQARLACWPQIEDFEDPASLAQWEPSDATQTERALQEERYRDAFPDNRYYFDMRGSAGKGISVAHIPLQTDWQAYQLLCFDARADRPENGVVLRIDDSASPAYQDRFTRRITLDLHWQHYCLPLEKLPTPSGKGLDIKRISRLIFSRDAGQGVAQLALDSIALIPKGANSPPAACQHELH